MKRCSQCREEKPFWDFYAQPTGRGGRRASCKACVCRQKKQHYDRQKASLGQDGVLLAAAAVRELAGERRADDGDAPHAHPQEL